MGKDQVRASYHNVSPDFFRTLEIPILRGRDIASDEQQRGGVMLINEGLADLFWPGEDPIGKDVLFLGKDHRVIGVVSNTTQGNVKHVNLPAEKSNHVFCPFRSEFPNAITRFVVRTRTESLACVGDIRAILKNIDPARPLYDVSTFKTEMNKTIHMERFTATFLTVFAAMAMILIVVGIYGVVSYAARQRTNEIGIRMALGAGRYSIATMILKHGLALSVIGTVIGIAGAMGLTRLLRSYLFEVSTVDPFTFVVIPVLVSSITLLACYIPARRAARIDPMEALRYE
jgi:predicted permease